MTTQALGPLAQIGNERIVRANGVDICVETIGDPRDPAILLIHGAGASMKAWDDRFCAQLAATARFVIRYDHRDTGQSISYPPGEPAYTLRDLLADAVGLLETLEVSRAHVVGRSMGGAIATLMALDYPDRVASLTLVGTSPGGSDLPPMSDAFVAYVQKGQPDWSDRAAVADYIVGLLRVFSGGSPHFDEAAARELVDRESDRTANVASSQVNHFLIDPGAPVRDRLGELSTPTLVIHGERDPVFPLDHGRALAQAIPDAWLLILEETGHDLPEAVWPIVVPAILEHTSSA